MARYYQGWKRVCVVAGILATFVMGIKHGQNLLYKARIALSG
jgi:hypothetical protein